MKKLPVLIVTFALVSLLSLAKLSADEASAKLAERLSALQVEAGLSDENFDLALVRWCQQSEAMSKLTPDHPLVKSGEFTVDDLHEQNKLNKQL